MTPEPPPPPPFPGQEIIHALVVNDRALQHDQAGAAALSLPDRSLAILYEQIMDIWSKGGGQLPEGYIPPHPSTISLAIQASMFSGQSPTSIHEVALMRRGENSLEADADNDKEVSKKEMESLAGFNAVHEL